MDIIARKALCRQLTTSPPNLRLSLPEILHCIYLFLNQTAAKRLQEKNNFCLIH